MRRHGHITRWDSARGFGFIHSPDSGADVFFHIRDFRGAATPAPGIHVVFEEIHVGGKGPRAMAVQPATAAQPRSTQTAAPSRPGTRPRTPTNTPSPKAAARRRTPPARPAAAGAGLATVGMVAWVAALLWAAWAGRLPAWSLGAVAALNLATLAIYAADKQAAQSGGWRVSEKQLHLLALAGGWPGAWWAQQWLRHKSSKAPFRAIYWVTVVLHGAALIAFLVWQPRLGFVH